MLAKFDCLRSPPSSSSAALKLSHIEPGKEGKGEQGENEAEEKEKAIEDNRSRQQQQQLLGRQASLIRHRRQRRSSRVIIIINHITTDANLASEEEGEGAGAVEVEEVAGWSC